MQHYLFTFQFQSGRAIATGRVRYGEVRTKGKYKGYIRICALKHCYGIRIYMYIERDVEYSFPGARQRII